MKNSLFVYMNGYEVGQYIQRKSGSQEFIYTDQWRELEGAIPLSLSLPLTEKSHRGDVVYNYFDNLLPDSLEVRNRIQARFSSKTNRPFDLLSDIGRDCVGAIQLLREQKTEDIKTIRGQILTEHEIAEELRQYKARPLGMSKDIDFRISIAGAQEKTALLKQNEQWLRPISSTPTTHIFKLPIGKIEESGIDLSESVENEWLCLEILKAFGLNVAEASIEQFENIKVLLVKRFDREYAKDKSWIKRFPVEDICQAKGIAPGLKYESHGGPNISMIMELLTSSVNSQEDRKSFMKAIFVFWLLGAIDGHGKNFSIFLKQGGRFLLAPFYDVISAYPLADNNQLEYQKLKMAMSLNGRNKHYGWAEIMPRHWYSQAKRDQFPESEMTTIIESVVSQTGSVIHEVSLRLPENFPTHISSSIFEGMAKVSKKFDRP